MVLVSYLCYVPFESANSNFILRVPTIGLETIYVANAVFILKSLMFRHVTDVFFSYINIFFIPAVNIKRIY